MGRSPAGAAACPLVIRPRRAQFRAAPRMVGAVAPAASSQGWSRSPPGLQGMRWREQSCAAGTPAGLQAVCQDMLTQCAGGCMPAPGAVAGWPHQSCHSRRVRKCMCVAPASAPLELRAPAPQPEPRMGPPWAPALPPARPHAPLPRARQRTTSRRRVRRRPLARPQTHPKQRRHRRLRTRTRAASSLCGAAAHARETQHGRARSGALSGTWRSTVAPWFMHSHNGYGMDSADDGMGRGRTAAGCARWRCRRRGRAVQAAQQVQHGRRRGGGRCGTAAGA